MKNIKFNAICNAVNSITSMLFPLITFTYASRCLGVEALGKYSYSSSIVDYFALLAGLGIETYAIREAAGIRDDRTKLEMFAKEITSISLLSTVLSYIILFLTIEIIPGLKSYKAIILIISIKIFFVMIGRNWLLTVYEDFLFQTIRSIAIQIIAIGFLFFTVRNSDSLPFYAFYCIFGTVVGGFCNYIYGKRYCKFDASLKINLKHIKPIMYIFATSISTIIYTSSDTTILGWLTTDYYVGLYAVSVKVYTLIRTLVAAVLIVAIPRFSYFLGRNKLDEFQSLFTRELRSLIFICFPAILGIFLMSKEIVYFIAGEAFEKANTSLAILSLAMLLNLLGYIIAFGVMIPLKKEKEYMYITIASAVINVALNYLLIPHYQEKAAAITTVISELFVLIVCWWTVRDYLKTDDLKSDVEKTIVGCIGIFIACNLAKMVIPFGITEMLIAIIFSILIYIIVEILMKNDNALEILGIVMKKKK